MTLRPRSAASWTTNPPTPPAAPTTAIVSPGLASSASTAARAVPPASGSAAASSGESPAGRFAARTAATVTYSANKLAGERLAYRAEDLVANGEARDARADRVDRAGVVETRRDREAVLHPVLGKSGADDRVHGVDAGRPNPDEQLSLTGLRLRPLADLTSFTERVDQERAHWGTRLVIGALLRRAGLVAT